MASNSNKTPEVPVLSSVFGVLSPEEVQAQLRAAETADAYQKAALSPGRGIVFSGARAGQALGHTIGDALGVVPPEVKKAIELQKLRADILNEAKSANVLDNPIEVAKIGLRRALETGHHDVAFQAMQALQSLIAQQQAAQAEALKAQGIYTKNIAEAQKSLAEASKVPAEIQKLKAEAESLPQKLKLLNEKIKTTKNIEEKKLALQQKKLVVEGVKALSNSIKAKAYVEAQKALAQKNIQKAKILSAGAKVAEKIAKDPNYVPTTGELRILSAASAQMSEFDAILGYARSLAGVGTTTTPTQKPQPTQTTPPPTLPSNSGGEEDFITIDPNTNEIIIR